MRARQISLLAVLFLCGAAFAADLKITVTDSRSAVIAGARVSLYRASGSEALATRTTGADGNATFIGLDAGEHQVEVLARGFAVRKLPATAPATLTVGLSIATAVETVVVTATGTPVSAAESGATVDALDSGELENMQPTALGEALRFLPGAMVATSGQRGGLTSLFVRGGDSRYNKVIMDGVPVNEPGGTFNFGIVPLDQVQRIEFARGAQSTLYGSDAMTSVVQAWSATGRTPVPEFRFGADGGNLASARGFASLAGARGRLDYNLFAEQFNTEGDGPNDGYSNSSQGANVGVKLAPSAWFRFRTRHSNSRTGVQGQWNFNGQPLLSPDLDQHARNNLFLASGELTLAAPVRWHHRLTGFEFNQRRFNADTQADRTCAAPFFFDCPFTETAHFNRAGLDYHAEYAPRDWATTSVGYQLEVEKGFIVSDFSGFAGRSDGLRRNHALFAQQLLRRGRLSLVGGLRFVHNESFGNKVVPRIAASVLVLRGGGWLSGTRVRFSYAEGIKAPRFEESFGVGGFGILPNPDLKSEENRALEAGMQQSFAGGKYALTATYFHNRFRNQINFRAISTFEGQFININRALAHGAEVEVQARMTSALGMQAAYVYTATQILEAPFAFDPVNAPGAPLLRRPRHFGSLLVTYFGGRWGAHLGGSFVGRRPDSDFLFGLVPPVNHTAGYARVDLGGWFALNRYVTAYANIENLLNRRYEEVAGYPALKANFRAGMRFRVGGE